ncbi:PREDICTED: WASH complex subunit 7 [Polistes canadensis]|uniref:WASH complex subunit 7 n=1 Tax=Polistes canadensis TaxID=91411 RepID=UPI000718B243|nr:PREDICTED: WASH complex subunit 7 [Polistes canadensis]
MMIESSSWNSKKDETIYKAAGSMLLRKYGQFFETLADRFWLNDSTLEYFMEGPIRLVYQTVEDVSIISLVEMESKDLSKLLAAVAGTCREIRLLKKEANTFYAKLFALSEKSLDNELKNAASFLSDLQSLSTFVNRIMTVLQLTTQQLCSLARGSHEIYLPALIEHFIDLFVLLVIFDEIIDAHPWISGYCTKYKMNISFVRCNMKQFEISETKLNMLDKLLKDLKEQLLGKTVFFKALEYVMDVNKGLIMNDQIVNYLKNLMSDVESKSNDNAALNKNWIRANVGVVVVTKLFGICDKKLVKRINETNKKFYAVTLFRNIIWIPSKFLHEFLPKEVGSAVSSQIGTKILLNRTQKLSVTINVLINKAMTWCLEMQNILKKGSLQISDIGDKRILLTDIITLFGQIKEIISFITNLHANLAKPMNRNTVKHICKLIEIQKSLQTWFYILGPVVVRSQDQVLQYLSYYILVILVTARKGLIQKDRGYSKERLDALSLIGLSIRLMSGPISADGRLIVRCALACASQLTETFKDEDIIKLKFLLDNYDIFAELQDNVDELCDYSVLFHHRKMIPAYLSSIIQENINISHLANFFGAFDNVIDQEELSDTNEQLIKDLREDLLKTVLEPACREIETSLRLHVYAHLELDFRIPILEGVKDGGRIVHSLPLPLVDTMIYAKRFVEHYLDDMFYNLTTVALHDWKTYRTMHALAKYKLNLDTVQNHLPTQTLEQGVDALEIMRNIHVFVSKYLYNLNTQTFIEHTSNNKHLNTIGIRHIANSIRTHGTGIMSTTVNFVYQFLSVKLQTFTQFMFDEQIKSRLMRDIRFIKSQRESGAIPYTYERAEKFQKGIRKLGMTPDGLSYLDQFRQLITHIGNALGYVRLIRSGGLHASSNAVSFLPDIRSNMSFETMCKNLNYNETTQAAAKRLEDDIGNLVHNFTEGMHYFKLLVDVFVSTFRDPKWHHLQRFYAIVPPLTLSFVDNAVSNKEKMFKRNQTGGAFTDDGFAMGVAYINALLDQSAELDALHWFETVENHINAENKDDRGDEKLQQTRALTMKRLGERSAEFQLLYYSLSGARVFFKQPDSYIIGLNELALSALHHYHLSTQTILPDLEDHHTMLSEYVVYSNPYIHVQLVLNDNNMDDCILDLKKLFFCCAPINNLVQVFQKLKEKEKVISIDVQKKILDNTVNHILIKRYPVKYSYQRAFTKLLIDELDSNGEEIDDDVYSLYCNFILFPGKDLHYRHFLQKHGDLKFITLKESINIVSKGTTGLCVWQGALHLAEWSYKNRNQFSGKNILELGCGVGLTGLSIINACSPKQYVFSDCHESVLDILCENVRLNLLPVLQDKVSNEICTLNDRTQLHIKYNHSDVKVIDLKWEDIENYTKEDHTVYDVILGADILYESTSFYSLIIGLNSFLTSNNYAIIAATIRNEDTVKKFLDQLGKHDLTYLECDIPEQTISIESNHAPVKILKVYKKNCNQIE